MPALARPCLLWGVGVWLEASWDREEQLEQTQS